MEVEMNGEYLTKLFEYVKMETEANGKMLMSNKKIRQLDSSTIRVTNASKENIVAELRKQGYETKKLFNSLEITRQTTKQSVGDN